MEWVILQTFDAPDIPKQGVILYEWGESWDKINCIFEKVGGVTNPLIPVDNIT